MNVRPLAEQDNLKPWLDDDLRSHGSLVGVDVCGILGGLGRQNGGVVMIRDKAPELNLTGFSTGHQRSSKHPEGLN